MDSGAFKIFWRSFHLLLLPIALGGGHHGDYILGQTIRLWLGRNGHRSHHPGGSLVRRPAEHGDEPDVGRLICVAED